MSDRLNKYVWEENDTVDPKIVQSLVDELDIPEAGARFLAARSWTSAEAARDYIFTDDVPPHDAFLFDNMEQAVSVIRDAASQGTQVLVHGDYDVDGICGTALLYRYLRGLFPDVFRFVPDRKKDGYGLAVRAVDWAIEKKVGLFIAVDCGTSDRELIERLTAAGIGVVVCDHHELPVDGKTGGILLNPVREGEGYPFRGLCGTGVAYKLVKALEARGLVGDEPADSLLDLTAIATVGDLATLTDENRLFVRAGLRQINKKARVGLKALKKVARLDSKDVNAGHIGYTIGPRINAPGRVSNPKPALELLCANDATGTMQLATVLETDNEHRKTLTEKVKNDALDMIEKMPGKDEKGGFVLHGEDWDEGVLGIAAARVVEEYGRPAVLISCKEDMCKGSGRSVSGVHLKEQLDGCQGFLKKYGGHAQAVGLTVERSKLDEFEVALENSFKIATASLPRRPTLRIDSELSIKECSMELVEFLAKCEPFGRGNRTPVWKIGGIEILPETRYVGQVHLKIVARDSAGTRLEGISFSWEHRGVSPEALHGQTVDLAATIKKGFFQDRFYPEIHVLDMRRHER